MVRPKGPGSPRVAGSSAFMEGEEQTCQRRSVGFVLVSKVRVPLACRACGHPIGQWVGRCPWCDSWGTVAEQEAPVAETVPVPLTVTEDSETRLSTGFDGVDRVLGGGLVPASVALLAGEPGIGKSTLLLHVVAHLASQGYDCLLVSGEESHAQVAARAKRLGIPGEAIRFAPGRDLEQVLHTAREECPFLLAVDSIQTLRDTSGTHVPGGVAQVRICTDALVGLAKAEGIAMLLT